jgi:hypothetical protein
MRDYVAPDGTRWRVRARVPGASNAMIVFHHPVGGTSRLDRYAWHQWQGAEARNVTARLEEDDVLAALDERALARLFRRSAPISTPVPVMPGAR